MEKQNMSLYDNSFNIENIKGLRDGWTEEAFQGRLSKFRINPCLCEYEGIKDIKFNKK